MTVTEQQLNQANIPRRYWSVGAKESSRESVSAIIDNLEQHFLDGDTFLLMGKDFATRTAVASWLGIKAMESGNRYFRDKWHEYKPVEPNTKAIPYSVLMADVDEIIEARFSKNENWEQWVTDPDIFIITELGTEAVQYNEKRVNKVRVGKFDQAEITRSEGEYTPGTVLAALDSFLRTRFNHGLVTIITMSRGINDDYAPAMRDILTNAQVVAL